MKISIICATIGPLSEVDTLIESVIRALRHVKSRINIEFIVIDQSAENLDHSFPLHNGLQVVHLYSRKRGVSFNRNIGLEKATGEWLIFMDSDCEVSQNYLICFENLLQVFPDTEHFMGRILDSDKGLPLFRKWPLRQQRLPNSMLWYYATTVNSIFKMTDQELRFDERFGLGSRYGSSEDIDFFLRLQKSCIYTPELEIFHPNIFRKEIPLEKLNSYSVGFGALCAKHALPLGILILIASLLKKTLDTCVSRVKYNDLLRTFLYRVRGFIQYFFDRIISRDA